MTSLTNSGLNTAAGVDRDLVGTGIEHTQHVLGLADATANGQRMKTSDGDLLDDVHDGVALVGGRGDIEEGDLVGAFLVIAPRHFDRIAGIADIDELDALDHAAGVDVETGMMRLARPMMLCSRQRPRSTLRAQLVGQTLAFGQVQRAFVDRTTGDRTDDVLGRRLAWARTSSMLVMPPEAMTGMRTAFAKPRGCLDVDTRSSCRRG